MAQAVVVKWDDLRSVFFGDISGNYTEVGDPFDHPARLIIMQNLTDTEVLISDDGVNDKLILPSGGQIVLDYMSDQSATGGEFMQPIGTQIWVSDSGVAATLGGFHVSVIYGKGE